MPGGCPGGRGMLKLQFDWYIIEHAHDSVRNFFTSFGVYLGVKACEVFLCFEAIRVTVYYADFFVFLVLHHW